MRLCAIALLAALLGAAACGFDSRSGQFECGPDGACDDGRVCVQGWCVTGEDPVDAVDAVAPIDADFGPFTCDDGGCTLVCGDSECGAVTCPAGRPCTVECRGAGSCSNQIDCGAASACEIICSGVESCGGAVECGVGPCSVDCSAADSCSGGVDCSDACACDPSCDGPDSCSGTTECTRPQCAEGQECVTVGGPCNQC